MSSNAPASCSADSQNVVPATGQVGRCTALPAGRPQGLVSLSSEPVIARQEQFPSHTRVLLGTWGWLEPQRPSRCACSLAESEEDGDLTDPSNRRRRGAAGALPAFALGRGLCRPR